MPSPRAFEWKTLPRANRHDPRSRQSFYSTIRPSRTVVRECEEAGCEHYARGWRTVVPADGPQALYIRTELNRSHDYREELRGDGMMVFHFPPGQRCFREHREAVEPPKLLHFANRGGMHPVTSDDVRLGIRNRETWEPADFMEHMHEQTDKIAELRKREGI